MHDNGKIKKLDFKMLQKFDVYTLIHLITLNQMAGFFFCGGGGGGGGILFHTKSRLIVHSY